MDVQREFCEKVMHGLDRLRSETLCPGQEGMFLHRTRGEVEYLESLSEIQEERLEAWRGAAYVDPSPWVWNRAQLRMVHIGMCSAAESVGCAGSTDGQSRINI